MKNNNQISTKQSNNIQINNKYYTLMLLLFILGNLFSQQIRLPDEQIFGNFTLVPDSLSITKDYSEFYRIHDPNRLNYRTILERMIVHEEDKNPWIYMYLRGNTQPLTDIHIGMQSHSIPELNIYGRYFFKELDRDFRYFTTQKMHIDWRPTVPYTQARLTPAVYFQTSKYTSDFFSISNSDIVSTGVSLHAKPANLSILNHLYVSANFVNNSQTSPQDDKKDYNMSLELDLNINLNKLWFLSETDLTISNYYTYFDEFSEYFADNFHFMGNFYMPITFLNIFALNIQYSEIFIPSILFEKSFYLNEVSELSISNFPYMRVPSLYEYNDTFAFAELLTINDLGVVVETNERAVIKHGHQVPLNANLKFSLFSPIETQMYINSKYLKNYYFVYNYVLPYYFYHWQADDFIINSVNLEVQKRIDRVTVGLASKYILPSISDLVPWESNFESSLSFTYHYKKYTFEIVGKSFLERYDSNEELMKNYFLLSNSHNFDISKSFKITLNLNNLLNHEYEMIRGLPSEKFNAEFVMRLLF